MSGSFTTKALACFQGSEGDQHRTGCQFLTERSGAVGGDMLQMPNESPERWSRPDQVFEVLWTEIRRAEPTPTIKVWEPTRRGKSHPARGWFSRTSLVACSWALSSSKIQVTLTDGSGQELEEEERASSSP